MKVVINKRWGGFGLSDKAYERLKELGYDKRAIKDSKKPAKEIAIDEKRGFIKKDKTRNWYYWSAADYIERNDPLLVQVVEELGEEANADLAKLVIVEIPDGTEFEIDNYDGMESVHEKHRRWG